MTLMNTERIACPCRSNNRTQCVHGVRNLIHKALCLNTEIDSTATGVQPYWSTFIEMAIDIRCTHSALRGIDYNDFSFVSERQQGRIPETSWSPPLPRDTCWDSKLKWATTTSHIFQFVVHNHSTFWRNSKCTDKAGSS
jgi:hypothetical protein